MCAAKPGEGGDGATGVALWAIIAVLGDSAAAFRSAAAGAQRVSVSATHSATHDSNTAGHNHGGSPVRLHGGQRACVVSHVRQYDRE